MDLFPSERGWPLSLAEVFILKSTTSGVRNPMRAKMGARAAGSAARFLAPVAIAVSISVAIAAALSGCGSQQSSTQALDEQFKKNPEFQRQPVARFAGTVTVDGQPPEQGSKLFIILTEFQHLDANAHLEAPKLYRGCDAKGAFAFGTYERADGVPAGKYVVTFVELNDTNAATGSSMTARHLPRQSQHQRVARLQAARSAQEPLQRPG